MSTSKIRAEDVETAAESLDIKLAPGHSGKIASMLSEIRQNVYAMASALAQDAPLSIYFDARCTKARGCVIPCAKQKRDSERCGCPSKLAA